MERAFFREADDGSTVFFPWGLTHRGYQLTDEAAELAEPWKIALIGVVLCGLSAFLTWLQPRAWWLGLLGVALGIGALLWSSLLKRARSDPPA
jgi:hypothetical protein